MELTKSYEKIVPASIRAKYDWVETRNAAAVLMAADADAFSEVLAVLEDFSLLATDITVPGKNKSVLASRLDLEFREKGWREAAYDTYNRSVLRIMPYKKVGEKEETELETLSVSQGYKIDNVKRRVAVDVEWNAKDGNLDRDVGAYRSFYDAGVIDGAVVITRNHASIRALSIMLGRVEGFKTTTTTNIEKLHDRVARGDGGGCPILGVGITDRCYTP
ncbi:hypothetical protein BH24CHL6_BH24CHL6_12170 [soil metagenome]